MSNYTTNPYVLNPYTTNPFTENPFESVDDEFVFEFINDAQWASSIEQTSDKMFSLWRPARTQELHGKQIEMEDGTRYEVTPTLMLIRMIKQRFEQGRATWAMHFDPAYLKLAELETRRIENGYQGD